MGKKQTKQLNIQKDARQSKNLALFCIALFLFTCLSSGESAKALSLISFIFGIIYIFISGPIIHNKLGVISICLLAYCTLVTISSFYSPAGKFALGETIKYSSSLAVYFIFLSFENDKNPGEKSATAVELVTACISILSIDAAGSKLITPLVYKFFSLFTTSYENVAEMDREHISTIFGNVNVFAGIAGIAIFLSLALLSKEDDKRKRRLHLCCLSLNSTLFLDSFSRGAIAVIFLAFILYLFLEKKEQRSKALVLMVETALFSGLAAAISFMTKFGSDGKRFLSLVATFVSAILFVIFDEYLGKSITKSLKGHDKTISISLISLLCVIAIYVVLGFSISGPASLSPGDNIKRMTFPSPGEQTLVLEADGDVKVLVVYRAKASSYTGRVTIYEGLANGASFNVPEDSGGIELIISCDQKTNISKIYYKGSNEKIAPRYLLIPEFVASQVQGMFQSHSYLQRLVYWSDGLKLWKESPIFGLGIGCFENKVQSIQQYHYEVKYVHNHYIQALVDTGIIGLLLFLALLFSCAFALIKELRKKEDQNPYIPGLFACLFYMAGQATTDLIFSSNYYLPTAYIFFAIVESIIKKAPNSNRNKAAKITSYATLSLLFVSAVFLCLNIYAHGLAKEPSYEDLVKAAKLDYYERNDYKISYVIAAAKDSTRNDEMTKIMNRYMDDLEDVSSNIIPYYLADSYFALGETDKAYSSLRKYISYSIANNETWNLAFDLALSNYKPTQDHLQGIKGLYAFLEAQNQKNLEQITLAENIQGYIDRNIMK